MPEQSIIVSCYMNPDCDGFACVIAYCELLNKKGISAKPYFTGNPQPEVRFLIDYLDFKTPDQAIPNRDSKIILVDASTTIGLDAKVDPANVIEIIDHRIINDGRVFKNAKIQKELVGAAATLIVEKFQEDNVEMSRELAVFLYGGIISNTLNLKSGTTTQRDLDAVKWLKEQFNITDNLAHEMFKAKSNLSGDKLRQNLAEVHSHFNISGKMIGIDQIEMIGAEDLAKTREKDILKVLNNQKKEMVLDMVFLTISDLEKNCNVFVCDDETLKLILENVLGIKFFGNIATRTGLIMRKQIVPLLKDYLNKGAN